MGGGRKMGKEANSSGTKEDEDFGRGFQLTNQIQYFTGKDRDWQRSGYGVWRGVNPREAMRGRGGGHRWQERSQGIVVQKGEDREKLGGRYGKEKITSNDTEQKKNLETRK